MPGLTVPRRRTRDRDDSEDEEVSDGSSSVRSGGSKRARLDRDALSEDSGSPVLPDSYRSQGPLNGNDEDTEDPHQPGSIVRVKLTDFVTYTSAEFLPGPSLNMVIGPNGTGKSTLVCAICLGLGWAPGNLGRAKDVVEYIKHGAREAEIEIELAGGRQTKGKNQVIRSTIKRDGEGKQKFFLNGRLCTRRAVTDLCKSFSIQIDNLCQFLPQDRVVEFAQMTPIEKLRETQRAVASNEVVQMHEELIKHRHEQKKWQHEQKYGQDTLNHLMARQNAQRADVERHQERQSLVTKETALRSMRPFIEYRLARQQTGEAKQAMKDAKNNLVRLNREIEPALRAANAKQAYRDQIKEVVKNRKRMVEAKERSTDEYTRKLATKNEQIKEEDANIQREKHKDDTDKKKMIQQERNITRIKSQLEEQPAPFDSVACNQKIRDISSRQRDIQDEVADMKEEQRRLSDKRVGELVPRKTHLEKELELLRSQSGKQLNKLQRVSQDTHRAWTWLQTNAARFEGTVYGPPIVTCNIKNPLHANAIESMIQGSEFTAFTVTNTKDFATLQDELIGKLKMHDISIRMSNRRLDQFQQPVSNEALQSYGFEGWLIDYIEGPEPVLAMLCDNSNLHRIPVRLQGDGDNELFDRLGSESPIQTWVAGDQSFRIIRRREYNIFSTKVDLLKPARFWTDQPVDPGEERDLRTKIGEIEMQMEEEKRQWEELKASANTKREEKEALQKEKDALEKEKSDRQKLQSTFGQLPLQLAEAERELSRVEKSRAELRQRLAEYKTKIQELQLEKGQAVLDYANAVENLRIACVALMEAEILHIEASSEFDAVAAENQNIKQLLEETRKAEKEAMENHKRLFERAKMLAKKCEEVSRKRSAEEAEVQEQFAGIGTMEDLDAEIESVVSRLELMTDGNPHAIKEFEKRAETIANTEAKLEDLNGRLEEVQDSISQLRELWEPQIDALVERISEGFSKNFEKINCAGQVQIDKHEDFDQWSIEILVRFRENEEMAILDSHRQSGGERAVSTIFYLMALQDMARSPFRVVDEINQGMDPRNERMVHERMVDIACQERTSQYFLITPKLLNGLKFHPKMKVHCIASGEYMPKDYHDLDFPNLLEIATRIRGQA